MSRFSHRKQNTKDIDNALAVSRFSSRFYATRHFEFPNGSRGRKKRSLKTHCGSGIWETFFLRREN